MHSEQLEAVNKKNIKLFWGGGFERQFFSVLETFRCMEMYMVCMHIRAIIIHFDSSHDSWRLIAYERALKSIHTADRMAGVSLENIIFLLVFKSPNFINLFATLCT